MSLLMDALRRAELEKRGDGGDREQPAAAEARDPAPSADLDAPAADPPRDLDTTQALPEDTPSGDDEDRPGPAAPDADDDTSGRFAGLTLSLEAIDEDEQDDPDDSGAKRRASLLGAGGGTSLGSSGAVVEDSPSVQAERPEAVAAAARGEPAAGDDSPTVASATSANAALRSFFDDGDTFDGTRSRPFAAEELEKPLSDTSQVTAETLFEAGRSGPGRLRVAGLVAASVGFALAFVAAVGFYYYQLTPTPQAPLPVAELPPSRPPAPPPSARSFTAETEVEAPSAAPPTAPEDTAAAAPDAVAAPVAKPAEPSPAPNPNPTNPDSAAGEGQRPPAEPDPLTHPALPGAPAPIAERAGGALRAARSSDLNGLLERAYADFGAGRLASAERRYRQVLDVVPAQRDATLGLAAIAERRGDLGAAFERYAAVLERHPGDEVAIAALFRLSDGADAGANPARLKVLLDDAEEPAPLWYALGRHYARRSDWRQAQEAFFNAFRFARDRADYAYNLAVALDRLGQSAAAVDYYQKALSLAGSGSASFSGDVVRARLAALREAVDARR